jgi:hypothetical protein
LHAPLTLSSNPAIEALRLIAASANSRLSVLAWNGRQVKRISSRFPSEGDPAGTLLAPVLSAGSAAIDRGQFGDRSKWRNAAIVLLTPDNCPVRPDLDG